MVGSDEDPATSPAWPVLQALSENPRHMGKVGEAAAIKLAFNQLVASLMVRFNTMAITRCHLVARSRLVLQWRHTIFTHISKLGQDMLISASLWAGIETELGTCLGEHMD